MDFRPLWIGIAAGFSTAFVRWLWTLSNSFRDSILTVGVGSLILGFGLAWHLKKNPYFGIPSFFQQIHSPNFQKNRHFWFVRLIFSSILILIGAPLDFGAVAIESSTLVATMTRNVSSRWFENQRRTDTAMSLSSGISALFGAPLTGILFSLESRTGGSALAITTASLFALLSVLGFEAVFSIPHIRFSADFTQVTWKTLPTARNIYAVLVGGVLGGMTAVATNQLIQWARKSILAATKGKANLTATLGAGLLFISLASFYQFPETSQDLFDSIILSDHLSKTAVLATICYILGFSIIVTTFGTVGIFLPLLTFAVFSGSLALSIFPSLSKLVLLCSFAATWSAFFRTPLAAAVLLFEFTGNPVLVIPGLLSSAIGVWIAKALNLDSFVEMEMRELGIEVKRGRDNSVLESIKVSNVMEVDFESAFEKDSLWSLHEKLEQARIPFLIIKKESGEYSGLLSSDVIEAAIEKQEKSTEASKSKPLSQLIEAKDLLYKVLEKIKAVSTEDSLAETIDLFDHSPVLPVVNAERKAQGLLFAHNVRIAYERELGKRAFIRNKNKESVNA